MGLLDAFRYKQEPLPATTTWQKVLTDYDVVDVRNDAEAPYVIVTERPAKQFKAPVQDTPSTAEIGTSSPSPFVSFTRREYNRDLQDLRGLEKYDQMRRSDGGVSGTLRLVKTPVHAARWFIEPDSDSTRDQNAANFVWDCLTKYMSISWTQVLSEALLMMDFGYYMFEKVWEKRVIDGQKRMIWSKLSPRHPMDVKEWKYDKNGGPKAVVMYQPVENPGDDPEVTIPIDKLLVFTFQREAGNIQGMSVLRPAYKHWYYKEQLYKIDAIQKERHGIGIPVIKLPPGFTDTDKRAADELGRNLRTNERAHVVLPPNWELLFAKLEGNPVDALKSIQHHDSMIKENILAGFINGDKVTKEEDSALFLKATRFIADIVCDTFNNYAIQQLCDYNFQRVGTPKLRARRIGEQADWRTLSFAIRNLIGAGVLRPDDRLEEWIREEMDLPRADVKTVRVVNTPQGAPAQPSSVPSGTPGTQSSPSAAVKQNTNANQVGLPRQPPPSAKPPNTSMLPNAGRDSSGG